MRDSIRLVATVRSANPSSRHSSRVRTLWPTSSLEIPQQGDEFADSLRLLFRQPALAEHQHVDVRQRVQLAAAVAADRHQRSFRDIFEAVEGPQPAQQAIDEVAARRHQAFGAGTGVERCRQPQLELLQPLFPAPDR